VNYYLNLLIFLFLHINFWFVISLIKKRNDIADVAWGLGFVFLAWLSVFIGDNVSFRGILLSVLVTAWGLRLAWHIWSRHKGKGEDYRYLAWRKTWGKWFFIRSYFQVFLLQGVLLFIVATPILLINKSSSVTLGVLDYIGLVIWLFGFCFEVISDWQLARFINNPVNKGSLIQSGLWSYSRHPNYFGEVCLWWGVAFMAFSGSYSLIAFIGPITLTFLILKVSGIPMLEKKMSQHPDFANYAKKVPVFIPNFFK
jgi:steroid 5-alpha reductase family enzyme